MRVYVFRNDLIFFFFEFDLLIQKRTFRTFLIRTVCLLNELFENIQ